MKSLNTIVIATCLVVWGFAGASYAEERGAMVLDYEMKDINGKVVDLSTYKGKVLLIVNVASRCGMTPQYTQLQALYEEHKDDGLVVIGFPANNFGAQEPGSNAEILEFCTKRYKVTFPMMAKVSVVGEDKVALYQELTSKTENKGFGGEVRWNFTKFLIGRDGRVAARFEPGVKPDADTVKAALKAELAKKVEKATEAKPAKPAK